MFQSKTVFILGAGASCEIGLPVGADLAKDIRQRLDIRFDKGQAVPGADWGLYEAVQRQYPNDARRCHVAALGIREGLELANSIDDFLDRHSADECMVRYGKMAIASSILGAERKSRLFVPRAERAHPLAVSRTRDTWYPALMRMLSVGVNKANLYDLFRNVSFVDFNYDRCVSQYFAEAIRVAYQVDEETAWSVQSRLKVLHPYGSIGELHYRREGPDIVPFGDPDERASFLNASNRIRLYTEQVADTETIGEIRNEIASAGTLVFLGFAFHDQNMKLITPPKDVKRQARGVFATAYKISDADCAVIRGELLTLAGKPVPRAGGVPTEHIHIRNDLTCTELLSQYSRSLVASR